MKRTIIIIAMLLVFSVGATVAGAAIADECMRYNNRKICAGDSAFDVITLFGSPVYKSDIGEVTGPLGSRNVELWIYQHKLRRWELTVANGRVLVIKKIRLRRIQ